MEVNRKTDYQGNKGVDALQRLIAIAFEDSHQRKYVRDFLLHLYNSNNPVDLVAILCACDKNITQDCLTVMAMRAKETREPHNYFENGSDVFWHLYQVR